MPARCTVPWRFCCSSAVAGRKGSNFGRSRYSEPVNPHLDLSGRTMLPQQLNILEFIAHLQLLNDQTLSVAQRACLKSIYGLSLEAAEHEVYERATGRSDYVPVEYNEATLIVGRRGGKTSKIAAPIACYEAFRHPHLNRGERGYVVLIAPRTNQAQIAFRFIRDYLEGSPLLSRWITKVRRHEIDLRNNITIGCYPCSYVAVRGTS